MPGGDGGSTEPASEPADDAVSSKLEMILSKIDRIEELNDRIKELESKQSELESTVRRSEDRSGESSEISHGTDRNRPRAPKHYVETDSGDRLETFEFTDEGSQDDDEVEFVVVDDDKAVFDEDGSEYTVDDVEDENAETFEFTYGCHRCKATVSEHDTTCPNCGEVLEDVPANTDWLEREGRKHDDQFEDDILEGGYYDDEYGDLLDEEYDPSPNGQRQNYLDYRRQTAERGHTQEAIRPPDDRRPYCENCGGETEYINRYDRWYCRRCSQYVPTTGVITETQRERFQSDRSAVLERILNRRRAETKSRGSGTDKPLSGYGPYAASENITHISMVEPEKRTSRFKRRR